MQITIGTTGQAIAHKGLVVSGDQLQDGMVIVPAPVKAIDRPWYSPSLWRIPRVISDVRVDPDSVHKDPKLHRLVQFASADGQLFIYGVRQRWVVLNLT